MKATIVFDGHDRVSGIRQTWTYDPAYSMFIARETATPVGSPLSTADLQAIASQQTTALSPYGFFTKAVASGHELQFSAVRDVEVTQRQDGQIEISFLLPLKDAADADRLVVEIHDPNYFAYFTIAPDGIALRNATKPCSYDSAGPKPIDLKNTKLIPTEFWEALDGVASANAQFVNRITVTCR